MDKTFDYIIIGSGFGGSVSAMRLTEKGYDVLVIEKGKRWKNTDFPETNWNVRKFLWMPALRFFGFMRIDLLNRILIFSGSGVGGGSLVYANTHMMPPDAFFNNPVWSSIRDWKSTLAPFYAKARFMLGSTQYTKEGPEDRILKDIAADMGKADTYSPCRSHRGLSGRQRQGCGSLISTVSAPSAGAASSVRAAWWAAATTPRTLWTRTTSGLPNNGAPP
jgi:cholesterol oxidase